jgi:hypothetical protein
MRMLEPHFRRPPLGIADDQVVDLQGRTVARLDLGDADLHLGRGVLDRDRLQAVQLLGL